MLSIYKDICVSYLADTAPIEDPYKNENDFFLVYIYLNLKLVC